MVHVHEDVRRLLGEKRDSIARIARSHGVSNVRVFGSTARGEARPDSDIDLLVTLEHGRSLLDLISLEQELEDLLERKVDVVTEGSVSPYIREAVLKEAAAL